MMMINKGLFSSASQHWATPKDLYQDLDAEFNFNDDPCPLNPVNDGLNRPWGSRTFCNPPYGREIGKWLAKALDESSKGKVIVCLIPSRTDTKWWHDIVMKARDIRFLRGRLKFGEATNSAPFPSAVVIFTTCNGAGEKKLDRPDREKIAEYLYELWRSAVSGYIGTQPIWLLLSENRKELYRNKVDQIIALIEPLIEEAKKQERERILGEMTPHDKYWRILPEHKWQALRGVK